MSRTKNTPPRFDGGGDILREKANELTSRLIVMVEEAAPGLARGIQGPGGSGDLTGPVKLELLALVIHLTDRFASASFSSEQRDVFMDYLLSSTVNSLPGGPWRSFKEEYIRRSGHYAGFGKLYPEEGEELKGTLFWEFGKGIANRFSGGNPASVVLATSTAMDVFQSLNQAVDEVGVFKYTEGTF